ncbi:calvin cycle protein CP12-1, chloroplastic-like [Punica granatum]|uniref:Calvin cycle protein CP12-1, chloroplastic-like n=2 Tax=Punica granatum TaxID=22663 RepID=A0A6P8ECM4_PUNGR|nr:calvin cycle protein CP12-1, chloroplastic-like [Punica granatum]PKI48184.1 hypothetical protein CRG98_031449 [Punica granatum]
MAATLNGLTLTGAAPRVSPRSQASQARSQSMAVAVKAEPWGASWRSMRTGRQVAAVLKAAPDRLEDKVAESIKQAEEACSEDPASGECAAAWDEVEELSAAASHLKDKKKATSDPLENYCKDNPETDECRTYDN